MEDGVDGNLNVTTHKVKVNLMNGTVHEKYKCVNLF